MLKFGKMYIFFFKMCCPAVYVFATNIAMLFACCSKFGILPKNYMSYLYNLDRNSEISKIKWSHTKYVQNIY